MKFAMIRAAAAVLAVAGMSVAAGPGREPARAPYTPWRNGPPAGPSYFPIAVWLQDPENAARYKAAGINLYVGLWKGPREEQLAALKAARMPVVCEQNQVGLLHKADPIIVGWMHGDEPDNAQPITDPATSKEGYGPPVPPARIVADYQRLRAADPTRPILLNLGQGVANDEWRGRGSGARRDDYRTYVQGGDVLSFDVYPVVGIDKPDGENYLWYVPKGVDRLVGWSGRRKIIWNCIECTHIGNEKARATPRQVRAEVWMSLIHGSTGIIWFAHEFAPKFNEHALLDNPEMRAAVTAINRQIHALAPVLNSATVTDGMVARSSPATVPIDGMVKRYDGALYLFTVGMRNAPARGTFALRGLPGTRQAEVIGEGRRVTVRGGRFADDFRPYGVHLYRIPIDFAGAAPKPALHSAVAPSPSGLSKRWLFVWADMSDPKVVDRMIARFPRAAADGYNGVAFAANIPAGKAAGLRQAAKQHRLDLVAIVMGSPHDRNYVEGVLSRDALFIARGGTAALLPDNPTRVVNSDFEVAAGNHFSGWSLQDDEGVTTFADHEVMHGGKSSLRMESIGKNQYRHCRLAQPVKLQPFRQYRLSFWVKSEGLSPADPEVKVLTADAQSAISFQTFHTERTQDWTHYDLVFNSLDHRDAMLYLGSWSGQEGKLWWDDLTVEEIGLVNVLRRPGCPVTVRGEDGAAYQEGRDFEKIVDPQLHPWRAYHEPPVIHLTPPTRIREGQRLRVSYYHPLIVYEDRLTGCITEPRIFADWRAEVERANQLLHPAAFFMSHDEMRVMNQCALCRSKQMTPGQLLAWNVRRAAGIIRAIRPDAAIWVWSDMFDPMHNAVEHYYAVNGPLTGSWKGLDRGIGIVNWNGDLMGKNCRFFANLGLKQILSGYYDHDEEGAAIARWLGNTRGIPGIAGAMYTTWEDRYDAMDVWARKAWGARPKEGTRLLTLIGVPTPPAPRERAAPGYRGSTRSDPARYREPLGSRCPAPPGDRAGFPAAAGRG